MVTNLESCGDGVVQAMEECDDGNLINTDACTTSCAAASCGDGYTWGGNEECDDGNQDNTDACTTSCEAATCGDGYIWIGNESCDDANLDNIDACTNSCAEATCGDGFVWAGNEECDDGNLDNNDGCTPGCLYEYRFVFVSSMMYTGDMGGLVGADLECQQLADDAGVPGIFMAWLSPSLNSDPDDRFTHSNKPYTRVDGVIVADNWNDLTDGTLDNPINLTELGGPAPLGNADCVGVPVWTGTNQFGMFQNYNWTCSGYTSNNGDGAWGRADSTTSSWTQWCAGGPCNSLAPIYCFEQ